MAIKSKLENGILTIEVEGEYAIIVEGTSSANVLYFELRDWNQHDKRYHESKYFFLEKNMIVPLIRALAILMKIDNHALSNITWLVTHELNNYNYHRHGLRNPNQIV